MSEVYKIGVNIAMTNNVSQVLGVIGRDILGVNSRVKDLEGGLNRVKLAIAGVASIAAGGLILKGVWDTVEASKEYANQLSLMNTLGEKQVDVAKSVKAAWKATYDVPTSSIVENLKTLRELHSVLGAGPQKMAEAGAILPAIAKIQGILTAVTGKEQERVGFDVVKSTELRTRGSVTPEALQRNMELMSQTLLAMQGTVTASDYHGVLKMSKGMSLNWSDDFTYKILPTLIQELKSSAGGGGQSAGTYLATLSRAVHGHVQKSAIPYWEMGGLIDPSSVVKNSTGNFQLKGGAVKGIETFDQSSYQWFEQFGKQAIQTVMAKTKMSAESAINSMFSDRNAAFIMRTYYNKEAQFDRDRKIINGTQGLAAYEQLVKTNPQLADMALQNQWKNIQAQLGYSVMPEVLKVTMKLIEAFKTVNQWMNEHQMLVKGIMIGVAAFGAALVAVGVVALGVAAGPIALWTLAIGAVASIIAGLSVAFPKFGHAIGLAFQALMLPAKAFIAIEVFVAKAFWGIVTSIWSAVSWIFDKVGAVLKWLGASNIIGISPGNNGASAAKDFSTNFRDSMGGSPASGAIKPTPVHVTVNNHVDGKLVSKSVINSLAGMMTGPQTGMSGYDPTAHMGQVAGAYSQ